MAAPAELGPPPPPAVVGPVGHVVYVDDDEVMQVMMEHWLRRQGYRVSAFADPLVALQALRAAPMDFDVVVTDFNMPGMSGLALAEVLAVLRPDLPVVISSGYVSEDLRESARRCGVREVIHKADGTAQLGALLQRLLGDTPS